MVDICDILDHMAYGLIIAYIYMYIYCGYITNLWPCRAQVLQSFAWPMRWLKATQTEIAKENNEVSLGRDFSCWSP